MLTFSGGGTRAAALAYGVLEVLRATPIVWEGERRSLLDEVDVISAVSGGSFTAAYYALKRERAFADFESAFLKRDVEADLRRQLLSPVNWARLASPTLIGSTSRPNTTTGRSSAAPPLATFCGTAAGRSSSSTRPTCRPARASL